MQAETIEEKLFFAAMTTEGMPFPQRVLRSGLKPITFEQARERFACQAIENAQNILLEKKTLEDYLEKNGWPRLPENFSIAKMKGNEQYGIGKSYSWHEIRILRRMSPGDLGFENAASRLNNTIWAGHDIPEFIENIEFQIAAFECVVNALPIDIYMEEIPDRVMGSYKAAVDLGFKEFQVAFPVLRSAAMEPRQQHDPILIGLCVDKWFEIDCWE